MKSCETDIVLEGIVPKTRNLYKAANKNTFSYVRKFLFKQIKHSTFTIYSNNIFAMVNAAHHFLKLSKMKIKPFRVKNLLEIQFLKYVKWPSGKIHLSNDKIGFISIYLFYVHPVFVLNFTVISMYIINESNAYNYKTRLQILDCMTEQCGKSPRYEFFGHMPSFSFYSAERVVDISTRSGLQDTFILKSTFSLLDHHVIQNLDIHEQRENMLKLMFSITYYKEILKVYFIQVKKIYQIMIYVKSIESHNHLVYDCPHFVAMCKRNFVRRMRSSTFQCIVQVLSGSFGYKAVKTHSEMYISTNKFTNETINIPNRNCFKDMCILHIDSYDGQSVNFSIVDLVSSATLISFCTYAGLSVGYTVQGRYKERFTVCDSHEGIFYSHNYTMIIVLYWYDDLSNISATIQLFQTECNPVYIDPCKLHDSCIDETCSSYLKLSFRNPYFPYLTISNVKARCLILHLEASDVFFTSCRAVVQILNEQDLVTQVRFGIFKFDAVYLSEEFYEEVTALDEKSNDTEHCSDIKCDIKTTKISYLK